MAKSNPSSTGDKPKRTPQGPRPAYMAYAISDEGSVVPQLVTRKSEELLKFVTDEQPGCKWVRFEIK